ncbi:uncharacterized protein LOC111896008 [Lactuca sativa]|uniref:uncharacterized protein LOC111896008 n=1 Tax=Lactuca sativa TaxID=4236 RepID=UPI000CD7FBA5|nr:uncharacterized protein LOC111896008 [Lactuca sativa]
MEYFDDIYAALTETVAAAATVADPIAAMRWLLDVEGCFFTYSCPTDQKVRCALNWLRSRAKDWWRLMRGSYTDDQRAAVTWEQFRDMFRDRYIPRVEHDRLSQEFLELRQGTETVTEVTCMFTERAMFCPEFALEHAQMTRYLSMLKTDIRQFVATQRCDTLLELQKAARWRELNHEMQLREQRQARNSRSRRQSGPRPLIPGLGDSQAALLGSAERLI